MNPEAFSRNRRILIVDDTPAIHADFRKLLGAAPATANDLAAAAAAFLGTAAPPPEPQEAFELTSACQGEEALKLVQDSLEQARPFALAFIDVRMPPGWDGIETTARLWQVDPDLQVVLCTAYSDYSWEEIIGRLGASDRLLILKKPFDRMEVLQLAKTLSEKWRLARQWNRRLETLDRLVEQRTEELRTTNQHLQVEMGERERTALAHQRAAERVAAFSCLGQRLSAAQTGKQAAQIILEVADQLLGWDACTCELYAPEEGRLVSLLVMDIIDGQRSECATRYDYSPPSPTARRTLEEGGQLILREGAQEAPMEQLPFGNTARRSASLLFVPIRNGAKIIGLLSIQSYTPHAYDRHSLETLQALADQCAGAFERIRAQEAQSKSEERLNAFFTNATTGLALVDKNLRYLQLNETLAEMNGLAVSQHLGRTLREVQPKLAPTLEPILQQVLATGKPALNIEFSVASSTQPSVQRHWVASCFPIRGKDGVPEALGGMVTEVTARKRLEAELRQAQKMEAIGQLAGGVAHDFNNLLAVIRGNAELVSMSADHLQAEQREFLAQIVGAADRAANLTRQLLAFSRKQLMQPQALNLNEVLGNLTKMLKRIIGEDIDLQCRYAAQSPRVLADMGMLEQVVLNLVVNARDAMPQGGHLQLNTETIAFDGTPDSAHPQARAGEFACLTVRDTGTGIAAEHLSRIFDPFFTTKEPGKGTGLGLATVYGIVQQHQGWLEVSSQVGAGSTFKVFLPALKAAVPETREPRAEPAPRGGTETILLVEDDEAVRSLTQRLLGHSGYQVRTAACGREALALWNEQGATIDLLLTDMIMPEGISGRDLAEQLTAQRPGLKVLFMSGYSGDALSKDPDFLQQANFRFLQKPCPARTLLETVRQALDAT